MRSGAELNRATRPFAEESRLKTWRLFATTMLAMIFLAVAIVKVPFLPSKVALSLLLALVNVRFFIFYHDYLHGALFRESRLGNMIMSLAGIYFKSVKSVWRESHNYHHKNNAKMVGSSIGSYPMVTLGMWRGMNEKQRFAYRAARHPLTILFGYFTLFMLGMCVSPFRRDPKLHWGGPFALVTHAIAIAWLALAFGVLHSFLLLVLPLFIADAAGAYLFYAQHNFPDAVLQNRREWDYTHAALRASSMMDMSPMGHWFTGNIGYHHVHHLNHRIPFYRLPEAMAAIPELQDPGRTSWRIADVAAALRLDVWDDDQKRMVSLRDPQVTGSPASAAG